MKKFFVAIVCFVIFANFSVCQADEEYVPPEVQEIFDKVGEMINPEEKAKKNINLVYEMLHKIPEKYPDDKIVLRKVYNYLGDAYTKSGQYDQARKYLEKAYQVYPNHFTVYLWLGFLEYKLQNYDKSNEYYSKALSLAPDSEYKSVFENDIGWNFHCKKNYNEAIKHYTKSLEHMPTDLAYIDRGLAFFETKDYSTAIIDFNKAILLNDKFLINAYFCRASAYREIEDYQSALNDYKKILEIDSAKNDVYFQIGYCYYELKNYTATIEYYTKYLHYYPNESAAYNNRGLAYEKIGKIEQANADFAKAKKIELNK